MGGPATHAHFGRPPPPHSTSPTHPLPPQERVWAQSLQQIAAIMVMHTARAQQLAQTVGKPPRPTLSRRTSRQGSLASLTGKSRLQASSPLPPLPPSPQSSPVKTTGRLLTRLSSLSSPSQSTEALTPTGPEASGASASQRQSRRSSGLASIHRLRRSLVRGPQMDQLLSELKLPQASRSLAARRTPAL
eukprot:scaffold13442_cov47-Phaeocystis_antarctica.AAC.2